ncbi:PAN-1 domain and Apple-like domain-containing protein [Strongyloides ratti]|uniref:PAN-1 domain and Apple-like domain-containing protein n=1 Tax=Strongyloides ratti TaxID=34506 RepID=A0A090KZM2_STRRB|nr:PAN-1 domain and Apple-like domain-containing protein [Strongyloides ratti]CEF62876.1 PAN-1 domain and Apple-like domain-containing protein [Strongyloides ratti]
MTCAVPIEYKVNVSLEECHTLCINKTPSCLTLQYDLYKKSCQVFNTPSPFDQTTGKLGIKNLKETPFRFRRQVNSNSVGSFELQKSSQDNGVCEITMLPSIGYSFIVFDQECYKMQIEFTSEVNTQLEVFKTTKNDTTNVKTKKAMGVGFVQEAFNNNNEEEEDNDTPPNPFKTDTPSLINNDIQNSFKTFSKVNFISNDNNVDNQVKVLPIMLDCPDSSKAKILITDGIEIINQQPMISLHLPDTEKCLYSCRINSEIEGRRFSRQCRSATYDKLRSICYIYDDLLIPSGSFDYNPNRQSIYFEKICLPQSDISIGCDEGLIKLPQHVLLGHATEIIDASSQNICIKFCITSLPKYGFKCSSIMYFYEFDKFNCILNKENRYTKYQFFRQELKQKVDYIELPTCMLKENQKIALSNDDYKYTADDTIYDEAEWGVWSDCDSSMTKTRTRLQCTTCIVKSETVPCIKNEKEFNKFIDMYDDEKGKPT